MLQANNSDQVREQGSALIVSLVMLLLLSLIGLAGIQTTTMQERMAANLLDKELAFQAAEAAAREGEELLGNGSATGLSMSFTDSNGRYRVGSDARPDWPDDLADTGDGGVSTYADEFPRVSAQPRYFIEQIDTIPAPGCDLSTYCEPVYYRITSAAVGGTDTAAAVITTVYRTR